MTALDPPVIIEPRQPSQGQSARASVIWLHGLGADGHDFEPIVPELRLAPALGIRFVFPHAPQRPVTINAGMTMRAWYDVRSPDLTALEDAESINASSAILHDYIDAEIARGINSNRIIVAGFSQGGAIALHAGLRYGQPLGGILALSCYLPLPETLANEANPAQKSTPILQLHGSSDPVIPVTKGETTRDLLIQSGYAVEWHSYPMPHSVCIEEIAVISNWLQTQLAG